MENEILITGFNESPAATIIVNTKGEILFHNPAASNLFGGFSKGKNFSEFISNETIPEVLKASTAVKLAIDPGATFEILKKSNGENFYASIFRAHQKEDRQTFFIRDISSQIVYIQKVKQQLVIGSDLSRSSLIRNGNLQEALEEIAIIGANYMEVSRINIWEFDESFNSIQSIVNYDKDKGGFTENLKLYKHQLPHYFSLMQIEEIIPTTDAQNNPRTAEIRENYILPFGIISLLDVPIRIEGKMMGVVCFEDTTQQREWNVSEQNFAVVIAQIIAQTIETNRRQTFQRDLEKALSEKKLLLSEINHRIKNNFTLISDLLRFQEAKAADEFHKNLFAEIRTRILSMTMIHRQLYLSDNIGAVNFRDFLLDLAAHFRSTFSSDGVEISTLLDNCRLPIGKAILSGLIVNELMTNACRHAFGKKESRIVTLKMQSINENVVISVSDNGTWTDENESGIGLDLINELAEKLEARIEYSAKMGTSASLSFSIS